MKRRTIVSVVLASLVLFSMAAMAQAQGLKPFVLGAEPQQTDPEQVVAVVKTSLQGQGFEVAGSYAPYPNAVVIVVTSDALKANAAKRKFGGYGAGMRVAVTKVKDKLQVSYTNPPYWGGRAEVTRLVADMLGEGLPSRLDWLENWLAQAMRGRALPDATCLTVPGGPLLQRAAAVVNITAAFRMLDRVRGSRRLLEGSAAPQLVIEALLIELKAAIRRKGVA